MAKNKAVFSVIFLFLFIFTSLSIAEEPVAKEGNTSYKAWLALASGFAIAIAALGGALGQGKAISAALDGIARNPSASGKMTFPLILGLALIETLVIYAFLIAFFLQGKI